MAVMSALLPLKPGQSLNRAPDIVSRSLFRSLSPAAKIPSKLEMGRLIARVRGASPLF